MDDSAKKQLNLRSFEGTNNYKMAPSKPLDSSSGLSTLTFPSNNRLSRSSSTHFRFDKGLLAKRSSKVAALLEENPSIDISNFFENLGVEPETVEIVARFCHGFDVSMSSENIIPLICISKYLGMTDSHSPNNLLSKSLTFFQHQVLPSWDSTIRALRAAAHCFQQAADVGLFDHCVESLLAHALSDPTLLGQPITFRENVDQHPNSINTVTTHKAIVTTRRKLFGSDNSVRPTEELSSLPLRMYEPILETMARRGVPSNALVGSLSQFFKHHMVNHNCKSETIEVIERLLPKNFPLPLPLLYELYNLALSVRPDPSCLIRLQTRIGKQLDRATVKDLLALDLDVESLKQVLKGYYGNYADPDPTGLVAVADLMEEYLVEVANESELDSATFCKVTEMVTSTMSIGSDRFYDGIYRAVDIYLDNHKLSDIDKEEVCRMLDFQKMSSNACDHAAQNQRLPLRVVIQALFISQLQLRDNVTRAAGQNGNVGEEVEGEIREKEEKEINERIKMIQEREKELLEGEINMNERIEIGEGQKSNCACPGKCKKKVSLWKEVKRKFGCMGSNSSYEKMHECKCHVHKRKKVNPNN